MTEKRRILFILILLLAPVLSHSQSTNYTYNYDFWNEQVASPDPYRVSGYILGSLLGTGHFRDPQGLFARENRLYVCDSGNNRIILLDVNDSYEYTVLSIVSSVLIDGEESSLNYPMDLFESPDGFIYIADTNNHRVLKLDRLWNYVSSVTKPDDESIGESFEFLPVKIIVDLANRLYVQARNVNKGLMEFDSRGVFSGYMGANKVYVSIIDYAWKFISTQAQKERMDLFVPTEYSNICLDKYGFIYVTNSVGYTDPVRRLNSM
jgi:DNA-binding beta-propeller fold protein YncE